MLVFVLQNYSLCQCDINVLLKVDIFGQFAVTSFLRSSLSILYFGPLSTRPTKRETRRENL